MLTAGILFLLSFQNPGQNQTDDVPRKPKCTAALQEHLWPEAANDDRAALVMLARSGKLEMCVSTSWGFRWEHITVNIHQAEKKSEQKPTETKEK